jgi:hypothetical protein
MWKFNWIAACCLLLSVVLLSCSVADKSKLADVGELLFKPPVPSIQIPEEQFALRADSATVITTSGGTRISIPAGVFENLDGSSVVGKIDFMCKELRTPAEIILSGITLKYWEKGDTAQFQTAGMLYVMAKSGGKELRLKEGKELWVDMVSQVKGSQFDRFYLDEKSDKGWALQGKIVTRDSADILQAKIDSLKQFSPSVQKQVANHAFFEPSKDVLVDVNLGSIKVPGVGNPKDVLWVFVHKPSADELQELAARRWNPVKLVQVSGEHYSVSLVSGEITKELKIRPVTLEKNANSVRTQQKLKDATLAATEAEIKRLQQGFDAIKDQNRVIRSFPLQSMGWHNCDAVYSQPNDVFVKIDPIFSKELRNMTDGGSNYYLICENNTVIRVSGFDNGKIQYPKDGACKLILLTSEGGIATAGSQVFRDLGFAPGVYRDVKIPLDVHPENLKSVKKLDEIIAKI